MQSVNQPDSLPTNAFATRSGTASFAKRQQHRTHAVPSHAEKTQHACTTQSMPITHAFVQQATLADFVTPS